MKEELFRSSDFLTVHLVRSDRTRGLIGEAQLRATQPKAWLIKTSRGPIVDADNRITDIVTTMRAVVAGHSVPVLTDSNVAAPEQISLSAGQLEVPEASNGRFRPTQIAMPLQLSLHTIRAAYLSCG